MSELHPPDQGQPTWSPDTPALKDALRLLIVDDQPIIRRGLAMILAAEPGIEVLGQAANGAEALELALKTMPDVVVMDLQMPVMSGVVATREITARLPGTRVVVLTTYDDDELVFEAIRAGAQAYLLKDAAESEVLETIRSAHRGESRLSPGIARKVLEQFRAIATRAAESDDAAAAEPVGITRRATAAQAAQEDTLTDKESRVLDLLAQGMSNKQIAAAVFLAEGTVKNYVSRIMEKLHAGTRLELALRAVTRRG